MEWMLIFMKGLVPFILVFKGQWTSSKITSQYKVFTDTILILSVIDNIVVSVSKALNNLVKIQKLVYKWKIYFNPGIKEM